MEQPHEVIRSVAQTKRPVGSSLNASVPSAGARTPGSQGLLCAADLNSQASSLDLLGVSRETHSLPLKSTDIGINSFPSTVNLAPDPTLCFLGHLLLSVTRQKRLLSPRQLPCPPVSTSFLGASRRS